MISITWATSSINTSINKSYFVMMYTCMRTLMPSTKRQCFQGILSLFHVFIPNPHLICNLTIYTIMVSRIYWSCCCLYTVFCISTTRQHAAAAVAYQYLPQRIRFVHKGSPNPLKSKHLSNYFFNL